MTPLIQARNLHRTYRLQGQAVHAVRGASLDVEAGEFLAVVGPSGSGKSTLLHLLAAVDRPDTGTVRMGDEVISQMSDRKRSRHRLLNVGLIFQRFHLLPMLTARENVELSMAEAGVGRQEREARAAALLGRVGLADRLGHRPGELSGGQQQRVAIARALANRPALLVADEPTGELDRGTSEGIGRLFGELQADGTAIIVATHDGRLAAGADRTLWMVDGRLTGRPEGTP